MGNSGLVRADLHNFLRTFSGSDYNDLRKVVNIASKNLGKGGIVGVTSCEDERYENLLKNSDEMMGRGYSALFPSVIDRGNAAYFSDYDIWVVKGQLFNASHKGSKCQLLVFGLERGDYLPGRFADLSQALETVREKNLVSVLYAPFGSMHPIGPVISQDEALAKSFSAVNTFHGGMSKESNEKAKEMHSSLKAKGIEIGALAFSGAHSFSGIGTSYTLLPRMDINDIKSPADVVSCLKKGIIQSPIAYESFKETYLPADALKHKVKLGAYIALSKINEKKPNKPLSALLGKMAKSQVPFFK